MGRIAAIALIAALLLAPVGALADAGLNSALASANKIADSSAMTKTASATAEVGEAASEVLRGNGTRAGYVLGHGSIVPGSEWVYIGVKRGKVNVDYTIDYSSGSLFFTDPVRQMDSVRVDYRYTDGTKGDRNVTSPGQAALKFIGGALQTNLTYAYRAADPSKGTGGSDILTYGLSTTTAFAGSSSLQSMFYVATPQAASRLQLSQSGTPQQATTATTKVKKDQLVLQNADFGLGGKARLKLGYQDVGQDFAGMQSLRDSKVAADDVLNQLDKERGLKRMNMTLDVPTGATSGLSFSMANVRDKDDSITSQAFGYSTSSLRFNYLMRDVGKKFGRFKDLKEAEAAQMAAEAGIRRTGYSLQFRTGTAPGNSPLWSGLSFVQLQGESGSLSYRSVDIDTGKVRVEADVRTIDPQFTAMGALNDQERTRMAQIARRQFDPSAQASSVTAADKAAINKETGINRKDYSFTYDGWLSLRMGNREAPNGSSVDTTRFGIDRKWGSIYFYHHRIDAEFDRLAALQPVEIARFGNETGMNRTDMGGTFKLGFGELGLAHGNVIDHQGATLKRQSVSFKNTRLEFGANLQDIDPRFSRTADLSDGDKKMLATELGFKRSDYSLKFKATRSITISSYVYDSTNVTAEQTRSQRRHAITYAPSKGPKVTALSDDFSYFSDDGNLSSYSHRKITFDNKFSVLGGLLFQGLSDENTNHEGEGLPTTTKISQTHLETDQKARTSYTLDTFTTDYGDERRPDDSWEFGAKTRLSSALALTGAYARASRQDDNSEVSGRFGFEWSPRKDLAMSLSISNRDGGPKGSQQSRSLSVKGMLAKRLGFLTDVNVDSGMNTCELKGKQTGCDNGMRVNAGAFGGKFTFDNSDKLNAKTGIYFTSRIVSYESDPNPNRKYHLTYYRQNLVTPTGEPARKRSYALDVKLSRSTSFTMTSYFGKDGKSGSVLPIGGGVFKLTRALKSGSTLFADFSTDRNESTNRYARTAGLGFSGTIAGKTVVEVYYGLTNLMENGQIEHDHVYRIKLDQKIDDNRYISLSAQRKSGIEKSSINPYEGNTTARLDFRTVFD